MSTVMARGRHHCEKDRSVANALRRESLQLDRTLRSLGLQHQRKLAGVCGAQLELRRTLDKRGGPYGGEGRSRRSATTATTTPTTAALKPKGPVVTTRAKPCCPNHIVCSTCNLRLRLADTVTRRFTPGLWTMYCRPRPEARQGGTCVVYRMPSFVERRNLSSSDNSSRYLPFI